MGLFEASGGHAVHSMAPRSLLEALSLAKVWSALIACPSLLGSDSNIWNKRTNNTFNCYIFYWKVLSKQKELSFYLMFT